MTRRRFIGTILYSILAFAVGSFPWWYFSMNDGYFAEYGLPLRWLTVHQPLTGEESHSLVIAAMICDIVAACLAGVVLSFLTAWILEAFGRHGAKKA